MWCAQCWVMMRDQPSQTLSRQRIRRSTQLGFFALFLAAPALNLLRFDLNTVQLWFLMVLQE